MKLSQSSDSTWSTNFGSSILRSAQLQISGQPERYMYVLERWAIAHLAVDNNEGSIIHLNDDDAFRFV